MLPTKNSHPEITVKAIVLGIILSCVLAGDNMQDLKAGYLLGATPWKQQVMQGIGTFCFIHECTNQS